jgi:hypothetical protein
MYDILYIKVNDHFFINEKKYFDKITEYYFNLYCNVFSKLGLENIHLLSNSDISEENKYSAGLNLYAGSASVDIENKNKTVNNKKFYRDFGNNKLFQKEVEKYSELKNDNEKNEYIYNNYLPKNKYGDSIMYKDSLKLELIKQRIENLNLLSFSETISFENSITSNININLNECFTMFDIGLNINLENHNSTKNDFTLFFEFYDVDSVKVNEVKVDSVKVNEVKIDEVKIDEVKVDSVKVDNIKPKPRELLPINIVQTNSSLFSGPWPSDCDEIESFICYERDLNNTIINKINENPRRHVLEIVTEPFNYRVKVWRIKDNTKPNIIFSNGIRYIKWDINNIENFDEAIETLRRNGYY